MPSLLLLYDKSAAEHERRLRRVAVGKFADLQRVFHRAQRKRSFARLIILRHERSRAGRQDQLVVIFAERYAVFEVGDDNYKLILSIFFTSWRTFTTILNRL